MKKIFIMLFLFYNILNIFAQNKPDDYYINLDADQFYLTVNTQEVFLIDVRLFKKYRKSRIEGALPAANKESLISLCEKIDSNTPIYLYCDDGDRSSTAAEILGKELGFNKVYNLKGGLRQWTKRYPLDESKINKEESIIFDKY